MMPLLQDSIRFSKRLEASPAQLTSTVREQRAVFKEFHALETKICPFKNLPEARRGQWGEGLTAAKMEKCNWMKPRLVGMIDYLEGTAANHLRHDDRGAPFHCGFTTDQDLSWPNALRTASASWSVVKGFFSRISSANSPLNSA